ncbi:MAG: glycosyltransferase family 2 protein [Patescibacteria group bacterium]
MSYEYLDVAAARDLSGQNRLIYRFFEMIPGLLSWGTIAGAIIFSWLWPVGMAVFIIIFDIYWLVKTAYLSAHLRVHWRRLRHNLDVDWKLKLENFKYGHIWQLVLLPMYKEDEDVVDESLNKIAESKWPKERIMVALAIEERAGECARTVAEKMKKKYAARFAHFLIVSHPTDVSGEISGKGSNIAFAARTVKEKIIDPAGIPHEDILVSAFDIDTQIYPQYFFCLTYHFLTADNPHRVSFQPVPIYNNNIWQVPALSRVVATSGTFWQMMQQERPERLTTFSSHALSFQALKDIGYWQKNMVSEDSRIFWKAFLRFDGDYGVVPLSYPVSLDANAGSSFWATVKNVYKQQRRWTWGVENLPYLMFGCLKNKKMPVGKKIRALLYQLEGFWSLTTNPLLIFMLGWLPLLLGGQEFNAMLLSYNLPRVTRTLMGVAMTGLVASAVISTSLLPPRPPHARKWSYISMVLQWLLIPVTIIFFGSVPGLDAQTRLMLGKYMGFWVTPKGRQPKDN